MVKKTVSIVIPNFNGVRLLSKNLPKVLTAAKDYSHNTEIIIVDDGSTDNSVEILKTLMTSQNDKNIKLITKKKNNGFSSACNLGVKKASGEILVLLNSDIWPEKDFLTYLIPHFSDPQVFAAGCLDKSWENGQETERGRGIGEFKNGFLIHARGDINKTNTLWASGGSSAFDRKKWLELGGFDENFNPFYWEDIDLSYRAQKKGYAVLFEPKAIVHHNHQEGAIKSRYSESQIKTISYRNQFIFVWKNITDNNLLMQHLLSLPKQFIKAIIRKDSAFITGWLMAISKLPKIFYYRTISNRRKIKFRLDKEILFQFKHEV